MPRTCTICSHRERAAINAALVEGFDSLRDIAARYDLTASSVSRHQRDHVPAVLRQGAAAARQDEAVALQSAVVEREREPSSLLDRVWAIYRDAAAILAEAKASSDARVALLALDRMTKILAIEGAALQALSERGQGESKTIRIEWGWTCPSCGLHRPDGSPPPLAYPEPAEGQSEAPVDSASDKNGNGLS
jgi:hypothetical protein